MDPFYTQPLKKRNINNDSSLVAGSISGIPVSSTAPTTNQVLQFNGTQYTPSNTFTFSTLTSPTINTPTITSPTVSTPTVTGGSFTSPTINTPTLVGTGGTLTYPAGPTTLSDTSGLSGSPSTWSTSWSGPWSSTQSGNGSYYRVGGVVTMWIPPISAAATNATSISSTSQLPASITPGTQRDTPIIIENNSNWTMGMARIATSGAFTIFPSFSSTVFTASGSAGMDGIVSWII
jgi:hypothetical protein